MSEKPKHRLKKFGKGVALTLMFLLAVSLSLAKIGLEFWSEYLDPAKRGAPEDCYETEELRFVINGVYFAVPRSLMPAIYGPKDKPIPYPTYNALQVCQAKDDPPYEVRSARINNSEKLQRLGFSQKISLLNPNLIPSKNTVENFKGEIIKSAYKHEDQYFYSYQFNYMNSVQISSIIHNAKHTFSEEEIIENISDYLNQFIHQPNNLTEEK